MSGTGGFQTQAYSQPAFAVAGDKASSNPAFYYQAGPGALVAGQSLTVGRFAWVTGALDPTGNPSVANGFGSGNTAGLVPNEFEAMITTYLADASMVVVPGYQVSLVTGGDYWVKNEGTTQAIRGQKAYANFSNGAITFAATGAPTNAASFTGSIAAETASFTGSIVGNVLTISAIANGLPVPGGILSGSGGGASIATNTQILSQLTGLSGSVGTYLVNIGEQNVGGTAGITISETYGQMSVTALASGTIGVGDVVAGTGGGGVTSGTVITALGSGLGGTGTYYVSPTQTVTSTSLTVQGNVETPWFAVSEGLAGELVKITTHYGSQFG
jgi:hypothetical protein